MNFSRVSALLGLCTVFFLCPGQSCAAENVQLGPRPYYLVNDMDASPLKSELEKCVNTKPSTSNFSIGHRGACMMFPEHSRESYIAAARMGAGIIECDVTFTKDKELVCRHSQCDLHTTTNILAIPELAAKCTQQFTPAEIDPKTGEVIKPASAKCCTSDITLAEFKTLKAKMDASNPKATTVEEYMDATPSWRTDLYSPGTVMTHKESIALFKELGVKMTPELKSASVDMPYDGNFTQEAYAQKMIDEYTEAGVAPENVFAQSFNLNDILYWIKADPEFGKQAVFLDDRDETLDGFNIEDPATWKPSMKELAAKDVNIIAPPLWMLMTVKDGKLAASEYAKQAKAAGLDIITWSLERSGPLRDGGGWYYQTVNDITNNPGDIMNTIDVLAQDVGVIGIFSDWAATVTYYANCKGFK
ncbi:glycerophosphodiester phosphodiesterase family protein [Desulfovibrio inopinatus]|uniref:glycerophosphodiester phosphodiesterase family protein n=1 Tax=Desulfovibrio inopinatus TaxID=102109 RepID=UPI000413FDA9|nr:glycerophosphodiester phosphodiesterase family protein [Desulfovibrio inopinatus]